MIRIYVICEGQTEETFVRDILSPPFAINNLFMIAQMIPTSKTQKAEHSLMKELKGILKDYSNKNMIPISRHFLIFMRLIIDFLK